LKTLDEVAGETVPCFVIHTVAQFAFGEVDGELGGMGLEFDSGRLTGGFDFLLHLLLDAGDFRSIAIGEALRFLLLLFDHLRFESGDFGIEIGKALINFGDALIGIGLGGDGIADAFGDGFLTGLEKGPTVFDAEPGKRTHKDEEVGPEPGRHIVGGFGTGLLGGLEGGKRSEEEE